MDAGMDPGPEPERDARTPGARSARRPSASARRQGAWLGAALALLVVGGVGYAAAQALWAPSVPFLVERPPARWITHPIAPSPHVRSGEYIGASAEFRRQLVLEEPLPESATLRVRGFRSFEVRVNGRLAAESDPDASWKATTTAEVAPLLRSGANRVRVRVASTWGPPALWLVLDGLPRTLVSDEAWSSSLAGGPERSARIADDTRPFPLSRQGPEPLESLGERAGAVLGIFALLLLGFRGLQALGEGAAGGRAAERLAPLRAHAGEVALGLCVVVWMAMAVHNLPAGSPRVGFDAPSHIAYAEHLLEHGSLPRTDRAMRTTPDGGLDPRWESHQPPLFYGLSALALAAGRAVSGPEAAERWLRLVPLLSGLGLVLVAWAGARVLLPRRGGARAAAVAFVAFAPMNVYVAHYVSNESLSALWIGAALVLSAWLLVRRRPGLAGFFALGAVSGLALMTKATFATTFPLVVALLAWKLWWRDRFGPGAVVARLAATAALLVPLGSWFWLRSWVLFGTPLVLPWEGGMGFDWWQDPGFHTADYFLRFGAVFRHPFFVGTHSFLDSVYATFWADSFVGGMTVFGHRLQPPWSYAWMAALLPLAVPATLLLGVGAGVAAARVVRRGCAAWALLLAAVAVAALSLLMMNLRIPYYAQAKSFYALGALVPLGLMGGAGFGWVEARLRDRGGPWAVAALRAYGATLALLVVTSFWARTSG